jgi:phage-related protein
MPAPPLKPVVWLADSLRELGTFPAAVQDEMGYAIYLAQRGAKHVSARPLKGLGPGVLEVVSDHRGDTFRSVYTVRFADRVFVLHAFQKKSKSGVATPKAHVALIKQRLKQAVEISKKKE